MKPYFRIVKYYFMYGIICRLILVTLLFVKHEQVTCTEGSAHLRLYLIGVIVLLTTVILITGSLVYCSSKGGVMDVETRKSVSIVLTIRLIIYFLPFF